MINLDELNVLVANGLVDRIPDPEGSPLSIYNYTFKVQMDKLWTPLTLMCRGLVLDDQGQVIGHPFPKFFNVNERPETKMENLPAEIPEITEKRDGSLIIVFFDPHKDRWRCCTRGSWVSDQAQWARRWLDGRCFNANKHFTYLFELTAPWNRIVVCYPETKMTLLSSFYYNGREMSRQDLEISAKTLGVDIVKCWTGPVTDFDFGAAFHNAEGCVVNYSNGLRVKMKYNSYCRLHKIMTGLSVKGIWEALMVGDKMDLSQLPDEFMDWYKREKNKLQEKFYAISKQVEQIFVATDISQSRKDIALSWKNLPGAVKSALFLKLDGREYSQPIWKSLKPDVHKTFSKNDETA